MIAMAEKKTVGHVRWDKIRRSTPEQVQQHRRWAKAEDEGVTLQELRELVGKSQVQVAATVGVSQTEVYRAERRPDQLLSSLRKYVEALGGQLEVAVRLERPGRLVPLRFPPGKQDS